MGITARIRPVGTLSAVALSVALAAGGCAATDDAADGSAAQPGDVQTAAGSVAPEELSHGASTDDDDGPAGTADASTPAPATGPAFGAATATSTGEQGTPGAVALLTDIRIGSHDGFDRVVLEYRGGVPGWEVRYVDEAVSDGIGEPVAVAGDSILQVRTMGVRYPEESDDDAFRGDPGAISVSAPGTLEVVEVVYDHVFEGYGMTFVGTDGQPAPFRVSRLANPTRLVIDVQHTA